jgi:hypothetical protein
MFFLLQNLEDAGNHPQAKAEQADAKTLDMMQTSSLGSESQAQDAGEGEESSQGPHQVDPGNSLEHAHVRDAEKDPTPSEVSIFLALLLQKLTSLIIATLQGFFF